MEEIPAVTMEYFVVEKLEYSTDTCVVVLKVSKLVFVMGKQMVA